MNEELGMNIVRSFKFLMATVNMSKSNASTLESEIDELKKLYKNSSSTTKIDNLLIDIIDSFKPFDLEYEAYEIIRDAIKIQDSGTHDIAKAITGIDRNLSSVSRNLESLVDIQKLICTELGLSNPTNELGRVASSVESIHQELQEVRSGIRMIANRR